MVLLLNLCVRVASYCHDEGVISSLVTAERVGELQAIS